MARIVLRRWKLRISPYLDHISPQGEPDENGHLFVRQVGGVNNGLVHRREAEDFDLDNKIPEDCDLDPHGFHNTEPIWVIQDDELNYEESHMIRVFGLQTHRFDRVNINTVMWNFTHEGTSPSGSEICFFLAEKQRNKRQLLIRCIAARQGRLEYTEMDKSDFQAIYDEIPSLKRRRRREELQKMCGPHLLIRTRHLMSSTQLQDSNIWMREIWLRRLSNQVDECRFEQSPDITTGFALGPHGLPQHEYPSDGPPMGTFGLPAKPAGFPHGLPDYPVANIPESGHTALLVDDAERPPTGAEDMMVDPALYGPMLAETPRMYTEIFTGPMPQAPDMPVVPTVYEEFHNGANIVTTPESDSSDDSSVDNLDGRDPGHSLGGDGSVWLVKCDQDDSRQV